MNHHHRRENVRVGTANAAPPLPARHPSSVDKNRAGIADASLSIIAGDEAKGVGRDGREGAAATGDDANVPPVANGAAVDDNAVPPGPRKWVIVPPPTEARKAKAKAKAKAKTRAARASPALDGDDAGGPPVATGAVVDDDTRRCVVVPPPAEARADAGANATQSSLSQLAAAAAAASSAETATASRPRKWVIVGGMDSDDDDREEKSRPLVSDPRENDVIISKGGQSFRRGNDLLNSLASERRERYLALNMKNLKGAERVAAERERRAMAEEIVRAVRSQDPPGRFLKKVSGFVGADGSRSKPLYEIVGERACITKAKLAMGSERLKSQPPPPPPLHDKLQRSAKVRGRKKITDGSPRDEKGAAATPAVRVGAEERADGRRRERKVEENPGPNDDGNNENNDRDGSERSSISSSSSSDRRRLIGQSDAAVGDDSNDDGKIEKRRRMNDGDDDNDDSTWSPSSSSLASSSPPNSPQDAIAKGEAAASPKASEATGPLHASSPSSPSSASSPSSPSSPSSASSPSSPSSTSSPSWPLSRSKSVGSRVYAEFSNGEYYWGYIGEVDARNGRRAKADARYTVFFEDGDVYEVGGDAVFTETHFRSIFDGERPPPPERAFGEVQREVRGQKQRADETLKRRREALAKKRKEAGAKKMRTEGEPSLSLSLSLSRSTAEHGRDDGTAPAAARALKATAHLTSDVPRLEPERPHSPQTTTKQIDPTAGPSQPQLPLNEDGLEVEVVDDAEEGWTRPTAEDGHPAHATCPPSKETSLGMTKKSRKRKAAAADFLRLLLDGKDEPPANPARLRQSKERASDEVTQSKVGRTARDPPHKCLSDEKENAKVADNIDGDLRERDPDVVPYRCRYPPRQAAFMAKVDQATLEHPLQEMDSKVDGSPTRTVKDFPVAEESANTIDGNGPGWNTACHPPAPTPTDHQPKEMSGAQVCYAEQALEGKNRPSALAAEFEAGDTESGWQPEGARNSSEKKTKRMSTRKLYKGRCGRCAQCKRVDCGLCFTCLRNARNRNGCSSKREVCLQNMCSKIPLSQKAQPAEGFFEGWTFACVEPPSLCIPPARRHRRAASIGLTLFSPMGRRFKSLNHAIRCFPAGFERDAYVKPFLRHIGCSEEVTKVFNI